MNILITGGAGFIGSQAGWYFQNLDHNVTLLDNMSYGKEDNLTIDGTSIGEFILADVRDPSFADHCINKDVIIHLAGIAPLPDCQMNPTAAYENNVVGTLNVLEACRKMNVPKIIFSSTSAIYENCHTVPFKEDLIEKEPDLAYSMSKRACEMICQGYVNNYALNIVIMRFFNVYGPHQDFMRKQPPLMGYIIKCLLQDTIPTFYSSGHQRRDYVYIDDVVRMMRMIIEKSPTPGSVFNTCSGRDYSVREIYDLYSEAFKKDISACYDDSSRFWDRYPILFAGKKPLSKERLVKEVNKHSLGSYHHANEILGWSPSVTIEQGIAECVKYAKHLIL